MSDKTPQNLKNHASFDPWFHIFAALVLGINLCHALEEVVRHLSFSAVWSLLLAAALIVIWIRLRTYPLKVQDRVIRLEERLRLRDLLQEESKELLAQLTEDQLIGLRFASDEELPALARQSIAEKLNRKQIKERIKNWRADYFRI